MKNSLKHLNFLSLSKKNFFITFRRRARTVDAFMSPATMVDDQTYYKQMKEFIKETQGVPRNSQKWWELRNKHYAQLRELYMKNQTNDYKESQEMSFVRFYIVIVPEDPKCYEIVSILNYYSLIYKAVSIVF